VVYVTANIIPSFDSLYLLSFEGMMIDTCQCSLIEVLVILEETGQTAQVV